MANNVYRFRRLKWGDPEAKLKMLRDATTPPPAGATFNWEIAGIVVGVVIIGVLLLFIL